MNESDFLDWIYSQPAYDPADVLVGPGDDMAVLPFDRNRLLVACDQVLDGVHVRLEQCGPEAAGRKAMARNLSDIAAMAALPAGAVASVSLPKGADDETAKAIYRGIRQLGDEFSCPFVGGDVSAWSGPLAIHVTVFAKPGGATGKMPPVLRSEARPGSAICVTGRLGGAWTTGRDLTFTPRVREALILSLRYRILAMIDLSDGLAMDLPRICAASGVGAEIDAAAIPIHPEAASGREIDPLTAALTDGEDYELLFCLPSSQARKLLSDDKLPLPITRIGTIRPGSEIVLIDPDGARRAWPEGGWEHRT